MFGRSAEHAHANFAQGDNFGGLGAITAQYGEPLTYGLDVTFEF